MDKFVWDTVFLEWGRGKIINQNDSAWEVEFENLQGRIKYDKISQQRLIVAAPKKEEK